MALIALTALGLVSAANFPAVIMVSIFFVAVFVTGLLSPLLWERLDARSSDLKHLGKAIFVELYVKDARPFISVFRSTFSWRRGRSEIYGVVFEVRRDANGAVDVVAPETLKDWRSRFINVVEEAEHWRCLYFYSPSSPRETGLLNVLTAQESMITGVTSMDLENGRDHGHGFFSDLRSGSSQSEVVRFKYFRFAAAKEKRAAENREQQDRLKKTLSAMLSVRRHNEFVDKSAKTFAQWVLNDAPELKLILSDDGLTSLREGVSFLLSLLHPTPPNISEQAILGELKRVLAHSYNKYSRLGVGAAAVDLGGGVSYGVNVENVSYPLGTCAEQAAIAAMIAHGGRRLSRVYLTTSGVDPIRPCGGCLQRIAEFATADCQVVLAQGDVVTARIPLRDLLPAPFSF